MTLSMRIPPRGGCRTCSRVTAVVIACILVQGCETLSYYGQAVTGQVTLLAKRKPVKRLLRREDLDPALRDRLETSRAIVEFAERVIGLDVGRRYRSFVDLKADSVVWNLFAAPEFSLDPVRWCYPFVGCAGYRGYFKERAARRKAVALEAEGFETFVGGVDAYSTLGWFNDPLLSTFIRLDDARLATLLMHELAHSRVWLPGDITFNESFATFVGEQGAAQWLMANGGDNESALAGARDADEQWRRYREFLVGWRDALKQVYERFSGAPDLRHRKSITMQGYRACYQHHRQLLGGGRYDASVQRINNARLVSIATYTNHVAAFRALYREQGSAWAPFFEAAAALADTDEVARAARLNELDDRARRGRGLGQEQVATSADDQHAEEIQCEAFLGHGFDAEASRAEHDDVGRGRNG